MRGDATGDNYKVTRTPSNTTKLIDRFGRHVTYARRASRHLRVACRCAIAQFVRCGPRCTAMGPWARILL